MFVDAAHAQSTEYQEFWRKLNRGEHIAEEYKRVGKGGKEVWIQASYNPIFDLDGRVVKVVNFITDVTGPRRRRQADRRRGSAELAEGDLEQRIETEFIPALEPLRSTSTRRWSRWNARCRRSAPTSRRSASATGEISTAADDLSRRTEQQASSLEETAAALEQITATVKKTAEGAKHARDVVSTAKVDADKSGEVVREAMAAMTGIDKSSKQISQIIGVIDEIAFQTNLLALNAGVEAARAGDAGRGFAVVASEVRALAQRSAEAAKEIKGLISTSTAQVDQGVLLVTQTGEALERIVAQVVEINGIITDIAASAQEQATGLQQVNTAVNEMDQVTQKNAAMVEETTAAAHALADETEELGRLVARYRIRQAADDPLRARIEEGGAARVPRGAEEGVAGEAPAAAHKPEPVRRPAAKAVANGSATTAGGSFDGRRRGGLGSARFAAPLGFPEINNDTGAQMSESVKVGTGKGSELIAFNIGSQEFCIGTTSVREIRGWTPATALPHAPVFVLGVVNLRGVVLPIVDLAVRLGFPPTQPTARHAIIVVEFGHQVAGLLVDGVSDIFTAGEDQIQPTPDIAAETAKLFLRGVIAMDGRLIGVIDIANLLPSPERSPRRVREATAERMSVARSRSTRSSPIAGRSTPAASATAGAPGHGVVGFPELRREPAAPQMSPRTTC